jgi:hypothetical protein
LNIWGNIGRPVVEDDFMGMLTPGKIDLKPLGDDCVVSVAVGGQHSLLCTSTGEVFACGSNSSGQLGFGKPDDGKERELCTSYRKVEAISHVVTDVAGKFRKICFAFMGWWPAGLLL